MTVSTAVDERSGRPEIDQTSKIPKTNQKEPQKKNGETRCFLKFQSGRKNSEKIWSIMKFQHIKTLMYRNCEICERTKLQGLRAEDAEAKPYLELSILVT